MTFLAILGSEHRRISRVLKALDRIGDRLESNADTDPHDLFRAMTFLRGFADGYHHEREEQVLLKSLVTLGYAADSGVLAFIRHQHREERSLLTHLEMIATAPAPWSAETKRLIVEAIRELTRFERDHMTRENEGLFPDAQKMFEEFGETELNRRLERYERERASAWGVTWLEKLGDDIAAAFET